ncbi:hypothetical protein FQJ99_22470, partial [Xanthomonas vasicola]
MRQLLQRCTFEPCGLGEVLRRKLGATIQIAGRHPCSSGAPGSDNQLKVFVQPMRVKLRGDTFFQEGQRHPATHAMRQLVVVCHRHAQASIVVPSDSVGL